MRNNSETNQEEFRLRLREDIKMMKKPEEVWKLLQKTTERQLQLIMECKKGQNDMKKIETKNTYTKVSPRILKPEIAKRALATIIKVTRNTGLELPFEVTEENMEKIYAIMTQRTVEIIISPNEQNVKYECIEKEETETVIENTDILTIAERCTIINNHGS